MLTISINNPRQLHLLLQGERQRITRGVKPLVSSYALQMQREIIRMMVSEPKHGQWYPRGGGRWHRASAAGEAPAKDTGALVNSIRVSMRDAGWKAAVGSPQPYAVYLEKGTKNMAARPAFAPALNRFRKPFIESIRQMVEGK